MNCVTDIYAEDTTLSAWGPSNESPLAIQSYLQSDIDLVTKWSNDNKMIRNASKTKSMLVTGKRLANKIDSSDLDLI